MRKMRGVRTEVKWKAGRTKMGRHLRGSVGDKVWETKTLCTEKPVPARSDLGSSWYFQGPRGCNQEAL